MTIRSAEPKDAERLLEIYAYYIRDTAVTFECTMPSPEEFRTRICSTLRAYPYLIAEEDGTILGYAYAGPLKDREAYSRSCEMTVYVDRAQRGKGLGRSLYETLEERLKEQGILNLYACIADPIREDETLTRASEGFHRHLGYTKVGEFHQCGYKFGRWYNMIWMEKIIGEHR
jgi:phosphinothricin acetyltransferase